MTNAFSFYIDSNIIRKVVIALNSLSYQIFEISLNSSLITDELSTQKVEFETYTIYSEKLNQISVLLDGLSKSMLADSTRLMEQALENTKHQERYSLILEGLKKIEDMGNRQVVQTALADLELKLCPINVEMCSILSTLSKSKKDFDHTLKKLWLTHTNLKVEAEKDELNILAPIFVRTESILETVTGLVAELERGMLSLVKQLYGKESV